MPPNRVEIDFCPSRKVVRQLHEDYTLFHNIKEKNPVEIMEKNLSSQFFANGEIIPHLQRKIPLKKNNSQRDFFYL